MKSKSFILVAVAVFAALVGGFLYVALSGGDEDRRVGALATGYNATRFVLDINGQTAGYLRSFSGCGVAADVRLVEPGNKATGPAKYEQCQLRFGAGMEPSVYSWINEALKGAAAPRDLAVLLVDVNNNVTRRIEMANASLTRFGIPTLSAASNEPVFFDLTVAPQSTRSVVGSGAATTAIVKAVNLLPGNMRLTVGGLDASKVSQVDGWSFEVPPPSGELVKASGLPNLGNLKMTMQESATAGWDSWLRNSIVVGRPTERAASIELLNSTLDKVVAKFDFPRVGIVAGDLYGSSPTTDAVPRRSYEMYVEDASMTITP